MDNELFEKAPIPEAYFSLAMPVVLSMLVTLVYNMVDTYFIAHTGNTDMVAGVSLTAPVFTVMIALGDIFGLGGSSVISRLFGQHRFADGKRLSAFCFYAAIATGLLILVLGLAFRDPMLALLGATDDTWQYASDFYTLIIVGSPFIIVSMTPSNLLRTEGHAVQSMIGSVAGTAVNIVLNPLFIHGFGWGAAGSAGATVIANICTDAYFVWFTLRHSSNLSIDPRTVIDRARRRLAVTAREVGSILAIGIPSAITNLTQSVGIVMINLFLLPYGTDAVAAMGIALKVIMIAVLVFVGFAFGAQAGDRLQLRRPQYASTARHSAFFLPVPVPVRPGDDRGAQPVRPSTDGILHRGRHHHHAGRRHAAGSAAEPGVRSRRDGHDLHLPVRRQGGRRLCAVDQQAGCDAGDYPVRRLPAGRLSGCNRRAGHRRSADRDCGGHPVRRDVA